MALPAANDSEQTWSSGLTFILAAVGAAVGLGNIWRFPYVVGETGGGAFVLVYLVCVVFVAIPILIAELLIGRRGSRSPPVAMAAVAEEAGRSRSWTIVGWLGLLVGYLIATYYSVIAGWTLAYIFKSLNGFGGTAPGEIAQLFDALKADPVAMTFWHSVFIVIALLIVGRGLQGGIEKAVKFLMPALFAMLLVMIGYAAVAGDFKAGFDYLFNTDFSQIDGAAVLTAIGQAFFSIGVAMGLMMAYGSYVPKKVSIAKSAVIIAGADTLVALLAGLMIFPLVFANGLDPASGPGLIFETLPMAFADMPGGALFGALFFLLLAFAAVTSLIALIEPIVAYSEDKWGLRRRTGCIVFGSLAWLIGLASVLSFNVLSEVRFMVKVDRDGDGVNDAMGTIFDNIEYLTANIMMPIGGILIALFVGWRMRPAVLAEELPSLGTKLFQIWLWMIRVVVPLAIAGVIYNVFTAES